MHFSWLAILLSFVVDFSYQIPQTFHEQSTCEIPVQLKKEIKHFPVPSRIVAKDRDSQWIINLCTKNDFVPGGESNLASVSLYNQTSKLWVNHDGNLEPYDVVKEKEEITISLRNEIKCSEDQNYLITIRIGKFRSKVPSLKPIDDCTIEIELTDHQYDPPCMKQIFGKWFIDLTPLRGRTVSLQNPNGDRYKFALCGTVRECDNKAACKIAENGKTIIGTSERQRVTFKSNEVRVVSSTDRPRKFIDVLLKCNWNVRYFSKPKLINEGTNYKFEVESSFGCVKLPQSCIIKQTSKRLTYDLTGLTPKEGILIINGQKSIQLSICGDLEIRQQSNQCIFEKSQVCEISRGKYLNKGSTPSFEITEGHNIRVTFGNGHVCNENKTYSTLLDLKCSFTDNGPTFVSEEDCVTKISWETPKACPKVQISENSCQFSSLYGVINLNELQNSTGLIQHFSSNQRLVYNICGRINSKCASSEEVSACFFDGNRQKIIGWDQPNLSFTNGKLQLKYTGERCDNKNIPYSLILTMLCSFSDRKLQPVVSRIDDCTFTATVFSTSACLKHWEIKNCTVNEENFKYDLSPLIKRDGNYEINDGERRDIKYFLNLCAPVIPRENLLFDPDSMISMQNSSVAPIADRFTSLGSIADPHIKDGKLVFESLGRTMCHPGTYYSSIIHFECSDVEGYPTLLKNDGCRIEFIWRTKHACLSMKKGGKCTLSEGNFKTTVPGDPIELKIDSYHTYYFSLCLDDYRLCRNDGSCVTKKLSKNIRSQNGIFYVQYNLNVTDRSSLETANFFIECDPYQSFKFSKTDSRNRGQVNVSVKTRMSCQNAMKTLRDAGRAEQRKEGSLVYETENKFENSEVPMLHAIPNTSNKSENDGPKPKTPDAKIPKNTSIPKKIEGNLPPTPENPVEEPTKQQEEVKISDTSTIVSNSRCNILDVGGKRFDLKQLDSEEFKSNEATYVLNFNGSSSKCGGLICKNGDNILSIFEKCPEISHKDDIIVLNYFTGETCDISTSAILNVSSAKTRVQVSLRCNEDNETTAAVSEDNCKIFVEYSSPKICIFSHSSISYLWIIISSILFVVCFVCFLIYFLYQKSYFKKCSYDRVSEDMTMFEHPKLH